MEAVSVRSETSIISQTVLLPEQATTLSPPTLRLRLQKPRNERKVGWREGTVDNEDMGKKKSKCCCIYKKPLAFGESSSEDDEECENCFGHPEKRRRNRKKQCDCHGDWSGDVGDNNNEHPTPTSVSE